MPTENQNSKTLICYDSEIPEELWQSPILHKLAARWIPDLVLTKEWAEPVELAIPENYSQLSGQLNDEGFVVTNYSGSMKDMIKKQKHQLGVIFNAAYPMMSSETISAIRKDPEYRPGFPENIPLGKDSLDYLVLAATKQKPSTEQTIKLLVLDSDGVLNDAGFYYGPEGEVMKKFNTRDGAGIKQIQSLGVEVGIITGEASGFTPARAAKLGITRIEKGCSNKLPVLDNWKSELRIEWSEIAYMGDDLPDIPCLKQVGMAGCPNNAEPEVKLASSFVSTIDGGYGCVRDFIRYMLAEGIIKELN